MLRVIAVIFLLLGGIASSQAGQKLTLGHTGVGVSPALFAANAFVADLKRRLPGRFTIDDRGGSTRGGDVNIWEGVKVGAIDMAILATPSIVSFVPELGVLDVPFLFRDPVHVTKVLDGPIGKDLGAKINSQGVIFLGFADYGFRQFTNSKRAIHSPADLAGLKIRVIKNPVMEMIFKTLGAEVVPLPFPNIYGALDDGRVDGQENPLPTIVAYQFDRVQKFVSLSAHIFTPLIIMINADTYKGLKAEEQAAILAAVRVATVATRQAVLDNEKSIVAGFRQRGINVTETVDRDAFIAALQPLQPEWERRFGADLLKRIADTK
jgi:tripartite ATP-independent transporter DctP family solute receptor